MDAVRTGPPPVPAAAPDLDGNEAAYAAAAVRSSWISSSGAFLDRFEREFADLCGTRHALAVSNGTTALHLALAALGIGPGDEVVVPSLTFVATANAVAYTGATPVFADVGTADWCLDPDAVRRALTPATRAVICVHLYGQPADVDALQRICGPRGIALVEDSAQAPFATYRDRPTGGLATAGTFSFFGNKVITCGEGGAVTTDDDALAARMRLLRSHGMSPDRRYWHPVIGYNYRLTNVAAAILCAQLERHRPLLQRRREIFARYEARLAGAPGLRVQADLPGRRRTPWLFSVLVDEEVRGESRDDVIARLADAGLDTRPFFPLVHGFPPYRQAAAGARLPVSELLSRQGLSLPAHPGLRDDDVDRVCAALLHER